jgi:hypothetical protein
VATVARVRRAGALHRVNAFLGRDKDGLVEAYLLTQAKMGWDEAMAMLAERAQLAAEHKAAAEEKDKQVAARIRAIELGFSKHRIESVFGSSPTRVSMTFEDAENVLGMLNEADEAPA